jgi:hypothetical protein
MGDRLPPRNRNKRLVDGKTVAEKQTPSFFARLLLSRNNDGFCH